MSPVNRNVNPGFFLFRIGLIMFLAELSVMLALPLLAPSGGHAFPLAITDAVLLTLVTAPFLWRYVVRPIQVAAEHSVGVAEFALRSKDSELAQSSQDWAAIFDTLTDMVTVHDRDFNIILANRAARKILNLPLDFLAKEKCYERYHGTVYVPEGCPSCQSLITGMPGTFETFEPHLNRFIEIRAIPRIDSGNRVIGMIHVVRDITERKRMEESLQEQKAFAENIIQNSAVATFVVNPAHRIVFWNKACEELTGSPAGDMIGTDRQWKPFYAQHRHTLADVVIDGNIDSASGLYSKFARSTLVPNGLKAEGWYKNLNGRQRYILFDAVPICDAKGKLVVVIETLQDITDLRQAEEDLARNEGQLRAIIETVPECVKLVDARGKLLEINATGLAMLEAESPVDVVGKSLSGAIVPEYRNAFQELTERTFRGESGSLEFELVGLKGGRRWVETRTAPLKSIRGEIIAQLSVTRDITEHKKLEAQLRHAQKMEAIGTLTGGIAHDFNNILTAIIGYGSILRLKMNQDDPLKKNADQIVLSAERASNLTQSLLTFSRKLVITLKPVNVNEIIGRVGKLLRRLIGEDIEFSTRLTTDDTTVVADSGQLEQVLVNLATNARDAMPDGGSLTIATELVDIGRDFISAHGYGKQGAYTQITVTDSGCGFDEDTRARIFEPFFTTKEVGKGTGLGLSIVYGIIKQHNGFINCSSSPGRGATFTVYLPVARPSGDIATMEQTKTEIPRGGSETVLIAEDDREVRKLTRAVLEDFGYTVIEAEDGEEAVTRFREHQDRIRLLLFDVVMPRMNGKEAYDEIRKIRPAIRVIFTSGYNKALVRKKGIREENLDIVMKPISPRDLLNKVREVLDT